MITRQDLARCQSLVIKIGSGVLVDDHGRLDRPTFCRLVAAIADAAQGREVAVVSSGAVALGRARVGGDRPDRARALPRLQALAAIGQTRLMHLYESEFDHYDLRCAQVLLTREGLDDRARYLNARRTLRKLWQMGCVPIINENDTVACDELRFGDNDQLAARVACLLDVDLLIICSDVDALYTANPHTDPDARALDTVIAEDPALTAYASDTSSADPNGVGTGGMITKLTAAQIAARRGIPTIITSGKHPERLPAILAGQTLGTLLTPSDAPQQSRKAWIATLRVHGALHCDAGAQLAVQRDGRSLLPSGLLNVDGRFLEGDAVELLDPQGRPFARGLAAYPDADMRRLIGRRSDEITDILGYRTSSSIIHRNDLVLLPDNADPH